MQESDSASRTAVASLSDAGRGGIPVRPLDRSHILRRSSKYPFPATTRNGLVRIRRERRVCESFSGIRALARGLGNRTD